LILASGSPQRKAILEQLGVAFRVEAPEVEEIADGEPRLVVIENARRKSRAVPGGGEPVLGADTAVVLGGEILGKPRDAAQARDFLTRLSGRWHEVMTGVAIRDRAEERSDVAVTRVRFRDLGRGELDWYLGSGEWAGRAGGYAIQGRGAALVEGIEGDYSNVVGLPIPVLLRLAPDLLG
jgi:septum formation protein